MFSTSLEVALLKIDWKERFGYLRCLVLYFTFLTIFGGAG